MSHWKVNIHQVETTIYPVDNNERLVRGEGGNSYGDIRIHRFRLTLFDKLLPSGSFSLTHRDRWLFQINLLNACFNWSKRLICLGYLNFLSINPKLLSLMISN